ncbi:MAG: restriction endonuclease subunit S [Bacteroidales bacterium]|jgi:type I restriction enzyme S subunit
MISNSVFDFFINEQIGFMVNSTKAFSGDIRLDSSHFVDDSNIIVSSEINFKHLNDFVKEIIEPKLFTRIFCEKQFGIPYISSSEMSEIEPSINSRFISKELTNNISQYIIKRGQILVSAAGTVGSVVLATKDLDGVAGTSDILRINVDSKINLGFIFTYLTSSYGANELANLAYGAIIKRVRGFQLEALKTPVIDNNAKNEMNHLILEALNLRDKANLLIKTARSLVLQYNNLPLLYQTDTFNLEKEVEIRLVNTSEFTNDYRLDAHFYNSMADLVVKNIKAFASNYRKINEDIADKIFYLNRFTRTFVEKDFGIPYLAGKDIIKIRPTDVSYLSKSETYGLDDYKLEKGWILMTCSGTLGRTCYIWNNYEKWVGTHDLIRIVCKNHFDSGYLIAFLSSDYGYYQATRYKHGAVIDHLTPEQIEEIIIPITDDSKMEEIGNLVRQAYDLRAEAILLEDKAQKILTEALTNA